MLFAELTSHARSLMVAAALWDVAGALGALPDWWPPVSYVLAAAAIAAACTAALLGTLARRMPAASGAPASARARTGGQLVAAGILLVAWLLRGHAEVPPDPPLIAAELVAAALYLFIVRRRGSG